MSDNRDIDTTGFELGMPTRIEMLEQQNLLMQAEYEQTADALTKARADIERLVHMLDNAERRRDAAIRANAKAENLLIDFREENERLEKRLLEQNARVRSLERQLDAMSRR
ncbi:hypothetical protein [Pseudomonas japonica]|uniref:Uncharacterized protein n=1 Tax=Pseudomonas japonica TaxID=256466 RepID=A0A239BTD3_9PSED|nr:hypothetical protein [Pseudomonas japonica]SNS10912.1 hypothetical protein SAMN05444352_103174 [Pseudomonas japonica]